MVQVTKTHFTPQNIDTDRCVEAVGNRFDLVLIAAARVRELRRGHAKQVSGVNTPTITALQEIEAGLVGREYLKRVRWYMSKGSRPRPYSVSQTEFGDRYDLIFRKNETMTPKVEDMKQGTCGCGRSPTGDCIGWHGLSEQAFQRAQAAWLEEELRKDNEVK
jgi:DNA-directed RNA polymerase omega subunit